MNKYIRFLIVFIVFAALILFTQVNDSDRVVDGKAISVSPVVPAAFTTLESSTSQNNLVLLEFFSGL